MRRILLFLILLAGVGSLGLGCSTDIDGPPDHIKPSYSMGQLQVELPYGISQVFRASEQAVTELGLRTVDKSADSLSGQIIVRDSRDRRILIQMSSTVEASTRTSIRVGITGDREKSEIIYHQILGHLL